MVDLDALLVGGFAVALALVVISWAAYLLGGDLGGLGGLGGDLERGDDGDPDGDRFNW